MGEPRCERQAVSDDEAVAPLSFLDDCLVECRHAGQKHFSNDPWSLMRMPEMPMLKDSFILVDCSPGHEAQASGRDHWSEVIDGDDADIMTAVTKCNSQADIRKHIAGTADRDEQDPHVCREG